MDVNPDKEIIFGPKVKAKMPVWAKGTGFLTLT
jgi:hypothetical protein